MEAVLSAPSTSAPAGKPPSASNRCGVPIVNVALIVANFAVFLLYELPNGDAAVNRASF